MKATKKKPRQSRSWRVIVIRSKGEYLGSVEETVAIKQFALDADQRSRLLIRERL
jgi:hypothetical protein